MHEDTTTSTVSGAAAKASTELDTREVFVARNYTRPARHPADPAYVEPPDDYEIEED